MTRFESRSDYPMDDGVAVCAVLARVNKWMTVGEVRAELDCPAAWLGVRLTLDDLVNQGHAEYRGVFRRQYRSRRAGGARAPKRPFQQWQLGILPV